MEPIGLGAISKGSAELRDFRAGYQRLRDVALGTPRRQGNVKSTSRIDKMLNVPI